MLYFSVYHLETDGGIMVTGSHNPPTHNGFKMMIGRKPFFGEMIQELGTMAAAGDCAERQRRTESSVGARRSTSSGWRREVADVDLGRLKVGWDAGNGAAGEAMALLTKQLPRQARHSSTRDRRQLSRPSPGSERARRTWSQLQETVAQGEAAISASRSTATATASAPSTPRAACSGATSCWSILARDVLKDKPGGTIIADVKASQVLFDEIAKCGGKPLMWKTGHSLIKVKMAETGSPLAGEMSGHIFFADRYYGFDDALYAAVRLLKAVAHRAATWRRCAISCRTRSTRRSCASPAPTTASSRWSRKCATG